MPQPPNATGGLDEHVLHDEIVDLIIPSVEPQYGRGHILASPTVDLIERRAPLVGATSLERPGFAHVQFECAMMRDRLTALSICPERGGREL